MSRLRLLLEMLLLCLFATAAFTIAAHTFPWPGSSGIEHAPGEIGPGMIETTRPLGERARLAIKTYCSGCHQSGRSGVDFNDETLDLEVMRRERSAWEEVAARLRRREMPPRKFPQPSALERQSIISWIDQEVLHKSHASSAGRYVARRLGRSEYINAIRDLFGIPFQPGADFPRDEMGWSRYVDIPQMSGFLIEKYRSAAKKILDQATIATVPSDDSFVVSQASPFVFLAGFARRAYRRPVDLHEVDRLIEIFERAENNGKTYEKAIKITLLKVLTSPHFLYRIETLDYAGGPREERDPFALASRLSFFLWRSIPDDDLLAQAEQALLADNLKSQVRRMLQDSRSRALAQDFAAAWLSLNKLNDALPDDEPLRQAMRRETEQFVEVILREDRSVLDFLDADYTFANERLAKHYGIAGVRTEEMQRISLRGTPRSGLLTHASVLTITSGGGVTSPANRGKWVLENLLGAPPIKPPAGLIEALENPPTSAGTGTPRQRFELHRSNPSCAHCHAKIDAIGLALENFDPMGAWRTKVGGHPIEALGILPGGKSVQGPDQLKAYLLTQREQFVRAFAERLLRFSLGRKLDERDQAALYRIPESVERDQYRFSRVIVEVVQSAPFLQGGCDDKLGLSHIEWSGGE